jgi:hypothetical protein
MRTRPNRRQFECAPDLWAWVTDRATQQGTTRTAVIINALEQARRVDALTAAAVADLRAEMAQDHYAKEQG